MTPDAIALNIVLILAVAIVSYFGGRYDARCEE